MSTPRLIFEFDPAKAAANLRKHKVSFREAMTVFEDPLASTLHDDQHSQDERRFVTVGTSDRRRLLFVVYTEAGPIIRLIGARVASRAEKRQYEEIS
jgi:hypothetical protein